MRDTELKPVPKEIAAVLYQMGFSEYSERMYRYKALYLDLGNLSYGKILDLTATRDDAIFQVASQWIYDMGKEMGAKEMQKTFRDLLGIKDNED